MTSESVHIPKARHSIPLLAVFFLVSLSNFALAGVCGDGMIDYASEQCDDGNLLGGDRCSATCASEDGKHLQPVCGDGLLQGEEQCDGNGSCTTQCRLDIPTKNRISISSCGTYDEPNAHYLVTRDLSADADCLTFKASNIIVDGQHHSLRVGGYGIYLREWNHANIIVKNFDIETTGAAGIYGRAARNVLLSNISVANRALTDQSLGGNTIDFRESSDIVLEDCFLENGVSQVLNRHQLSGASVRLGSGIVRRCIFKGTPQNGIAARSQMHIFNNYGNGGTEIESDSPSTGYTNNFFIGGWNTRDLNINNNVVVNAGYWATPYKLKGTNISELVAVDLPILLKRHIGQGPLVRPLQIIHGRTQNRGIFHVDGSEPQSGIAIYNNYSSSYLPPNNEEYAGCQMGGATGLQLESIARGVQVFDNTLVAVAAECSANAAKPSSRHQGIPNVWEGNRLVAIKVEKGTGDTLEIGAWKGLASAVTLRESVPGTLFRNNHIATLVVDASGRSLEDQDTGADDVALWTLADTSGASGFVFERTQVDVSRTPKQKLLSTARVWSDALGTKPEGQQVIWRNTTFADDASMQQFLDNIESVYDAWGIGSKKRLPILRNEVQVIVERTSVGKGIASLPRPMAPKLLN